MPSKHLTGFPITVDDADVTNAKIRQNGVYVDLVDALASAALVDLTTEATGTLQAAQEPAHTGDVTNSAGSLALTIAANAVTNAKAAQMAANTIKLNNTGATANAIDGTAAQARAMLALTTTRGDMIRRNATVDERFAIGAAGTALFSDGTDPGWRAGIPSIATLAAAKALTGGGFTSIYVEGRSSSGDGYQGLFRWSSANLSASVTADTTFAVFVPPNAASTGASGAWVRVYDGRLNAFWFGALGDGTTDDKTALQAWLDLGNFTLEPLFLPAKTFKVTGSLLFYSDTTIIGASFRNSIIKGSSVTNSLLKSDAYTSARRYRATFRDFTVDNTAKTAAGGVGIDLRNVSEAHVERVLATNVETGFQWYADAGGSLGCFYNRLINCEAATCVTGLFAGQAATSGGTNENLTVGLRIVDVTNGIAHSDGSHNGHYHPSIETFTTTGIGVTGTEAGLQIISPRLENSGGVGTGISLGSSVVNPTVFAPKYVGLSTNLSDSSATSVVLSSDTGLKFGGGTLFSKIVKTTATIDYPSIAANASNDQLVTVTGATASMMSMVMPGAGIEAGLTVSPIPTSGGVYMRVANVTTAAINPASMTVTVLTFFQ